MLIKQYSQGYTTMQAVNVKSKSKRLQRKIVKTVSINNNLLNKNNKTVIYL